MSAFFGGPPGATCGLRQAHVSANVMLLCSQHCRRVASDAMGRTAFQGREQRDNWTGTNDGNEWFTVELPAPLELDHYTLRHGYQHAPTAGGTGCLRSWDLEGSADGTTFTLLRRHTDDTSLNTGFASASWGVTSSAPFRHFRIRKTGPNAAGSNYLTCCGLELYGVFSWDPCGPPPKPMASVGIPIPSSPTEMLSPTVSPAASGSGGMRGPGLFADFGGGGFGAEPAVSAFGSAAGGGVGAGPTRTSSTASTASFDGTDGAGGGFGSTRTGGATATAVGFGVSPGGGASPYSGILEVPASRAPGAFALGAAGAEPAVSAFGSAAGGGFDAGGFGGSPSFGSVSAPGAPVGGTPGTGSAASVDAAGGGGITAVPAYDSSFSFGSAVGATPRARSTASFGAAGEEGPGSTPAAAPPVDSHSGPFGFL